ncbi:hypothetical protein HUJ04_008939 [Dendroctonus ponderosae]
MTIVNSPTPSSIPIRSIIWVKLFTCTLFLYMLRTNMSLILLAMVDSDRGNNDTQSLPECLAPYGNATIKNTETISAQRRSETTFDWDPNLQGLVLGSYFWGFFISNMPAGAIAERYGPRNSVAVSFTLSSILTLFGPLCASVHPYLLIANRFVIGLLGGIVYPAVHCLIAKWAPPAEKGKFISATLGSSLGTVFTWPLLGAIIEHLGWNWAFWTCGILGLLWTVLWVIFVRDSPEQHPWISSAEKEYISHSLAGTVSTQKRIPPYKSIFLSVPSWALCVAQFGNLWGLFFLMTAGPKFMSSVLGFDLGHTGFLAALPYLARMIAGFSFGAVGDLIVRRAFLSKTALRKSFMIFSHIVPGCLLIAQTLVGCQATWVTVLLTLSLAFNGASTITNLSNAQDLAPNFAGSLYGIANCVGSTTGIISPMVVGYLTSDHNGIKEWHIIFYIGAAVYIACGLFFMAFASAEIQPWNYAKEDLGIKQIEGIDNTGFQEKFEDLA